MIEGKNSDREFTDEELYALYTREASMHFNIAALLFIFGSYAYEFYIVKRLKELKQRLMFPENVQALNDQTQEMVRLD